MPRCVISCTEDFRGNARTAEKSEEGRRQRPRRLKGAKTTPLPMHGVSEWTRERQQERADEHPGEGEAGLEREKPRDASAHARQSLAICSLLEVVVLAVLLGVSLQQLSLSPLLYVGAGLALGALGALCSCCGVAVRVSASVPPLFASQPEAYEPLPFCAGAADAAPRHALVPGLWTSRRPSDFRHRRVHDWYNGVLFELHACRTCVTLRCASLDS